MFVSRLVLFVRAKCFRKKNKQVWNCLNSLNLWYYWRVPQSTRLSKIYFYTPTFTQYHLWASLFIHDQSWAFFLICENHLESLSFVWIYLYELIFTHDHLWASLLFMKIFLNLFYLWESLLFHENCFLFYFVSNMS